MADNNEQSNKKEQAKYKFGLKEIDLNKYIHNLGTNLQIYMDKQTDWSDGLKQEFVNAYNNYILGLIDLRDNNTGRFYTDDAGQIYDNSRLLSNVDNDDIDPVGSEYYYDDKGNQITTDDYNRLRKRKQKKYNTFSANREVAKYFNLIGRAINPVLPELKEKFDLNKHGFVAYWNKKNNKTGEKVDLKPYLDMDAYDPETGKRALTNRLSYMSGELQSYINDLADNYDWKDAGFESLDAYKQTLLNLVNHMSDGTWDHNDEIAANQAGLNGAFYNAFFTEDEHPNLSDDDREKLKKERENKAKQEAQEKWINEQLDIYDRNLHVWTGDNRFLLGLLDSRYWDLQNGFNGDAFRESFNKKSPYWNSDTKLVNYDQYINDYLFNPYSSEGKKAIAALIGMGQARQMQSGKYQGMYYIPLTKDKSTNSGLMYDPTTGTLFLAFIGDIPEEWERMKRDYNLTNGYSNRTDEYKFKDGGILTMQLGGGFDVNAWMEEDRLRNLAARGAANTHNVSRHNGRTAEKQEAGERKAGIYGIGVDATGQNPEAGFSGTDFLRLGTIAADIVSMGAAFVPGYGTAVSAAAGVGSSLGTFFADAFEDGLDSGDFKSLGMNLGMDLLGAIPGGGTASKGVKIAKNLGKYATRIIATVGAMHTLSNGKQIIDSYNKLLSSPKELTVDDWRNISAGLGLITGGVAAGTRKYQQAKMKAANAKPNNVAVELFDKKTNTKKTVLFDGDDATAIREANKKGDVSKIQEVTRKYDDYKDLDVSTESTFEWKGFRDADKKWQNPLGSKTGKARVFDVSEGYDIKGDKTGKTYALRGKWEADVELDTNIQNRKVARTDQDVAFGKLRRTAEKVKRGKDYETRFNELDAKLNKEGLSNNPGTGRDGLSEALEYYRLRGKNKKSKSDLRIGLIRRFNERYKDPNYKSKELADFEAKYVKDGQLSVPIEGISGTWADIVKKYGLRKEGGTLNNIRKFYTGGATVTGFSGSSTDSEEDGNVTNLFNWKGLAKNAINRIISNPTFTHALPRALYANKVNKELTLMAKDAEKPYLLDPVYTTKTKVTGDLNSEIQGLQNKANINRMARNFVTSSPEAQAAMQFEAAIKGEDYVNQGLTQSNLALKASQELNRQETNQEALMNQERFDRNKLSAMRTLSNKSKFDLAQKSREHEIYNTVWSQDEYELRAKQAKKEALDLKDIDTAIAHDLGSYAEQYGAQLSPEEIDIWTAVNSGTKLRSDLTEDESAKFNRALDVADLIKSNMIRQNSGIPYSPWSRIRQFAARLVNEPTYNITDPEGLATGTVSAKNGTKLEIARLKARQADADRFLKSVEKALDRHQKMLDKLSDSIYGFLKASR